MKWCSWLYGLLSVLQHLFTGGNGINLLCRQFYSVTIGVLFLGAGPMMAQESFKEKAN